MLSLLSLGMSGKRMRIQRRVVGNVILVNVYNRLLNVLYVFNVFKIIFKRLFIQSLSVTHRQQQNGCC